MHVIAGGGGAFTHGTRVHRYPRGGEPACAFPDQRTSRRLAASVPLQTMLGTAGILPHLGCAALAALRDPGVRGRRHRRLVGDGAGGGAA